MSNKKEIKHRVKSFFLNKDIPGGPAAVAAGNAPVTRGLSEPESRHFSIFNPDDQARSTELLLQTIEAFSKAETSEEGVSDAMQILEQAAEQGDMQMAQHVLGIFATHAAKIKPGTTSLPIPPLVFAAPQVNDRSVPIAAEATDELDTEELAGEDLLHWFREDIHLNEHHRHWHMVYNTSGIPTGTPAGPAFPIRMKKRQGEVFIYMHRQMIARYETERMTADLDPVIALTDFSTSLGEGYDPNAREPINLGYVARSADATMPSASQFDLENRRQAYHTFLQTGKVGGIDIPINAQTVGTVLESNIALLETEFHTRDEYFAARDLISPLQLHNVGHGVIAGVGDPGFGVMTNPHTSLQDPVFWRWHKMIDDLAEQYYSSLPSYDFSQSQVTIESNQDESDSVVILTNSEDTGLDLGMDDRTALKAQLHTIAQSSFENGTPGSSTLRTGFKTEQFIYQLRFHDGSPSVREFERDSLFCERFAIGLQVLSTQDVEATARIFICADAFLDLDLSPATSLRAAIRAQEHRFWIELDRQPVTLSTGENILTFLADESSIVRKLRGQAIWPTSAITEQDFDELHDDAPGDRDDYCDCGWPINLLLPKGSEAGTPFKIMAMVSEGSPNLGAGACGSRSFCGSDFNGYPELDDINMGFPFDRPAPDGTVNLIRQSPNMAIRSFTIRHQPDLWSELSLN